MSDDEPEPVYVAGRAVPPGAVVTMTNTASSSEVEEAIKSAKKGVARVLPKKRVIVEDEDENASGEEEGVYVRDAEQGRFDACVRVSCLTSFAN